MSIKYEVDFSIGQNRNQLTDPIPEITNKNLAEFMYNCNNLCENIPNSDNKNLAEFRIGRISAEYWEEV